MKKLNITFLFCLLIILFIRCEKVKTDDYIKGEKIVESFYKKHENIIAIDSLISYQFYQKIPYNEFKIFMDNKHKTLGNIKNKELINTKVLLGDDHISFENKITYEKGITIEKLKLIKEGQQYKIVEYNVSSLKN